MLHFSATKSAMVVVVILASIFFSLPNMLPSSMVKNFPSWWQPMNLGLDLQGGSYLLLEVDTSAVYKEQLADVEETARAALREIKISYRNIRASDEGVFVTVNDPADLTKARDAIAKNTTGMEIDTQGEDRIHIVIPERLRRERQSAAVSQSLEIVRRRIDEFGTTEPSIQRQGADRIIVELPGVENPERVKALLGQTAKMNFHLLEPNVSSLDPRELPPGTMLLDGAGDESGQKYVVRRRVEVSGERLIDSQPSFQEGQPVVTFRFDTAGGRRFGQLTSANVGQRLAIVLDNKVISAPLLKGPIVGGSGIIEGGGFTVEKTRDLALLLRAGALPAPLNVLEERSVGPGLGADSIEAGATAAIVGGGLVVVFMIIAYHTFGLFAVFGQIFHMLTLFAFLSLVGGTLTLPGIAGVVLSLGIAVDANVLIY
ncbi:MAG: protein translocase subunit SecD, partial [Rhodospirillaceae bacterium]|nr:protein translocase subunit SecD [Rhodospirillaceae bacterium]